MLNVIVKAGSKQNKLIRIDENNFIAYIKAIPKQGKANAELIILLSKEFKIAKNKILIKHGLKSKHKIIKIY